MKSKGRIRIIKRRKPQPAAEKERSQKPADRTEKRIAGQINRWVEEFREKKAHEELRVQRLFFGQKPADLA